MTRTLSARRLGAAGAAVALAFALGGCSALSGVFGGGNEPVRDEDTSEVTESSSADVFSIQVGDCIDDAGSDQVSEVPVVPCADAHDYEVFHEFELPEGDFPGDEAIAEEANTQCSAEFESFIGTNYDESSLWFTYFTPLEDGWNELDDRLVQCMVYASDDDGTTATPTEGSLKDSKK